jgi:hypothetical protein
MSSRCSNLGVIEMNEPIFPIAANSKFVDITNHFYASHRQKLTVCEFVMGHSGIIFRVTAMTFTQDC